MTVPEAEPGPTLSGVVRAPSGQPVAGALVAAFSVEPFLFEAVPIAHAVTDVGGRFGLALDLDRDYSITATAGGHSPAYGLTSKLRASAEPDAVSLTLGSEATGVIRGRLLHADGRPAVNGWIRAFPNAGELREVYLALPDARGAFQMPLRVGKHLVKGDAPDATYVYENIDLQDNGVAVDLRLRPPRNPPPRGVTADLRRAAVPVRLERLGVGTAQDERLSNILCDARLVGIGESTHGSSEFTRLRGQVLFHLAKTCGFNALLVEADMRALASIDDYVMTGEGDPAALLFRVGSFPFTHEEFLALIRAIRAHNERTAAPIRIVGFDSSFSWRAAGELLAWLGTANPALRARVAADLAVFEHKRFRQHYSTTSDEVREKARAALAQVRRFFDERGAKSERTRRRVALLLVALESVERRFGAPPERAGVVREKLLVDNTRWAIEKHLPGAKAVIAAHNGHVLYARPVWKLDAMGDQLAQIYGDEYVSVGVFFGTGSFRALKQINGKFAGLDNFSVGPPLPDSLEERLDRVGLPAFLFDMRNLSGPMKAWLDSELLHRELAAVYTFDAKLEHHTAPAVTYDVMAYIAKVNAIVPVPKPPADKAK